MTPFIPHTHDDVHAMLDAIGVRSVDDLFADIPHAVRLQRQLNIPDGQSEWAMLSKVRKLAGQNQTRTLFSGAGQYDHIIPSAVRHLAGRSEFVTAYTPYQPELSQGILQALFEFQSVVAEMTGLPVSNASLYDGFTAAAEACVMAINSRRKARILLIAGTIHPHSFSVLKTYFGDLDVDIRTLDAHAGRIEKATLMAALNDVGDALAGVLVQTPNIYGALEDLEGWANAIHDKGGKFIISAHPLSLGALKSPLEWGADIAVGDTQPLGLSPYFGGPSAGYIACTKNLMRRMPGRIVGETVDADGKRAYVLTLQAREQHIKRERATSNICTNQSLAALANTIYMALIGPIGFQQVAEQNINSTAYLRSRLHKELNLVDYTAGAVFNEFTLRIPIERARWDRLFESYNIHSGVWLADLNTAFPSDLLCIAVTEKRIESEIETYIQCAREAMR